jgi:flagellar basal body-associated protein FliL
VILIVVLMVIAGGGVGTMKWLEMGPFAPETDEEAALKMEASKPTYISMDPLTVNVFSGNKILTTLRITLKIEVRGSENSEFVYAHLPKISDALFQDMHAFLPRIISKEDKSLDVFLLKKRLKLTTDKLYPKGQIYNVLVQAIDSVG